MVPWSQACTTMLLKGSTDRSHTTLHNITPHHSHTTPHHSHTTPHHTTVYPCTLSSTLHPRTHRLTHFRTPTIPGAGAKPQASSLPPLEFSPALCTLHWTVAKLKSHFDEWFLEPLSALPNAVTLCREGRRTALRALETVERESLQGEGMKDGNVA